METKLRSVLRSQQSKLLYKAVIFGGFLSLAKIGNLGLLPVLFFTAAAIFLYAQPLFKTFSQLRNFLILLVISILAARLTADIGYFAIIAGAASLLFYLILGIKDLVLINRNFWQRILSFALFYSALLIFFYSNLGEWFLMKSILVFLVAALLTKNLQNNQGLISWVSALIMLELVWVISLLPLTALNSANLALLGYFILIDRALIAYSEQGVSRKTALSDLTIFIVLFLLILATTKWGI